MFSAVLTTLLLLSGCNGLSSQQDDDVETPSALVVASAAATAQGVDAAVESPHEGIAAPGSQQGSQPASAITEGPVPPFAPVAIGDGVEVYDPTPIFLPAVANNAGATSSAPFTDDQAAETESSGGNATSDGGTRAGETVPPVEASGSEGIPPNAERINTPAGPAFSWQDTENYLILGTDRRAQEGSWRTDSIMVVGLDRANNRAAVFSIPRDLYVNIPGYGWGRINQADYMGERREENGGPALVGQIVEDALGIPTEHFVRIQMDGFVDFVDALGGVNIYLDCPFSEPIFNLTTQSWTRFTLPAGQNHLDGEDAYWFARLRLEGSDIGRSSRQRAIIWAMRDQILSTNALLRLPELYTAFNDTITTDLGLFDIIGLAQTALSLDAANVRASGLTLRDLQNYTTDAGAQVLVIGNADRVRALVEDVWTAPAMADAFRGRVAGCAEPEPTPEPEPTALPDQPGEEGESDDSGNLDNSGNESTGDAEPLDSIITDPVTGQQFDSATGLPIDPSTGLPYDPADGN